MRPVVVYHQIGVLKCRAFEELQAAASWACDEHRDGNLAVHQVFDQDGVLVFEEREGLRYVDWYKQHFDENEEMKNAA